MRNLSFATSRASADMEELNLLDQGFQADPHPILAEQRETGDGVHYQSQSDAWVVHRYDDVRAVLKDTDRFSNMWPGRLGRGDQRMPPLAAARMHRTMVFSDPPIHTRLRALVSKAFNVRAVRTLEERIIKIADGIIDELEPESDIEFVHAVAVRMPLLVIGAMIGVDASDQAEFAEWAHAATVYSAPAADTEVREENMALAQSFWRFTRSTVADRRAYPRDDLVSELLEATIEGDRLSDEDVTSTVHILLIGSFETTRTLLTNFLWQMFENPDVYSWLRSHPERIRDAVEETLRLEPPLFFIPRVTKTPVRIGETDVDADQVLLLCAGSANRDPRVFERPDEFVADRSPNAHVSFGFGAHFCIGAPVVRSEAEVLLPRLLATFPGLAPGGGERKRYPMTFARAFSEFPVHLATSP